jgi:tetratricopeptide (TPR) repeat protein
MKIKSMNRKAIADLIAIVVIVSVVAFSGCISAETAEEWDGKGTNFAKLGEYKKAIECFDKAIELNPNLAEAYCNRGNAYFYLKQYERAIED